MEEWEIQSGRLVHGRRCLKMKEIDFLYRELEANDSVDFFSE